MKKFLKYLSLGILSTILTATPGLGAERISFFYPPFGEFSLSAESLEKFAKEGKINSELAFYASRATPEQLAQLRQLLQQKFEISPVLVSQFTYSPLGEAVVRRLGELLLTDSRQNGFYAIRAALILSAASPEGLNVVNLLRKYPSDSLRLNFSEGLQVVNSLVELGRAKDQIVALIKQQTIAQTNNATVDFAQQPDLRSPGNLPFQITSLKLNDNSRDRSLPVDIYLPQASAAATGNIQPPFPLVVISHGVASDRYAFIYLAEHLASHGFAVAVLEHPGSNAERFQLYFAGLAGPPEAQEFLNRPLDVKFVLDQLQQLDKTDPNLRGKINFQQIGAIGHSFGGYTVMALGGGKINFDKLRDDCNPNRTLNVSVFLQCRAFELPVANYPLQDDRIKAVMAINPIDSSVLGEAGVSQIKVPTMLVAGSEDIFAPPIAEQIYPFTWLPNPNKYLVVIENATHFSAIAEPTANNNVLPVPEALLGPNRAPAYSYIKALSLAFLQTHLLNRSESRTYLQPAYAQYISQSPLNLSLIQSLTPEQLKQALNGLDPQPTTPAPKP
ncbi:alpha/beta hydrolase [Calothrix sp. FACHB-1219]|uniref:alpha/beta hydrolase n=1 Tax=unclassified Calothrix TaxID=2619626 RepID=UPI001682086C|nr:MULTISPECIES: alpha/beta hydrolase [unclassified Calothrix]MBD2202904.1 alpha/beta hydrolase [Calothrix sp. FACHB-168]MBD2216032.1 alpha/beta hydrolase [Calothrix sp. FACHB-1219]